MHPVLGSRQVTVIELVAQLSEARADLATVRFVSHRTLEVLSSDLDELALALDSLRRRVGVAFRALHVEPAKEYGDD